MAEWDALNRKRNQLIARFGPHPLSQAIQRNTLQAEDLCELPLGIQRQRGSSGEAGIPGIRYLDQGSRACGRRDAHNYVVFPGNEALIDILRKYGIPAALASALAKYAQQPQGEQLQ